jgi:hypothetical protein
MPRITVNGIPIDFPDTGNSPDWSEAIIDFADAVADTLSGISGAFDVPPQVMNIDSYNPTTTNTDISNLSFSTSEVRGAVIDIAVSRATASTTVSEMCTLTLVYNEDNSVGQKWEMAREMVGDGQIQFNVTDSGQVQFTTTAISGANHTGILTYRARAILNT